MINLLFTNTRNGRRTFMAVITARNVELLLADKPLHILCEELNLKEFSFDEFILVYFDTTDEAVEELTRKGYITKDTIMEEVDKSTKQ